MTNNSVRLVYALDDPKIEFTAIGGKAAGLAGLIRQGLPVPPGFVLTIDAFSLFLEANGLEVALLEASATDVRSRLASATWPDALAAELEGAYAQLMDRTDGASVAVRSSAIGEDSAQTSFAGQHQTVLNVTGIDAVREAVLDCWASLHGEEVAHYRRTHGVEGERLAMPVVVQALVPADASGVAFTLDPISGDRDVVLIEAARGLGEGVVSGLVTPDHYRLRKSDGVFIQRELARQHVRVVPAAGSGVVQEELDGALAEEPVLNDEQAQELARLAVRIEREAGEPRDIEWALAGGSFYVLQSRPVTGVTEAVPEEGWVSEFDTETRPETIWTSANVQEVLPGQLSPFSSSIQLDAIEKYGLEPIERIGIELTNDDPFFAFFYGRAFLNVTMMLDVVDQTPFGSRESLMDQYLSQSRAEPNEFDLQTIPHRPLLKRLVRYLKVFPRMLWYRISMPRDIKRAEKLVDEFMREDVRRPLSGMSDGELVDTFERDLDRSAEVGITHVGGGGLTGSAFEALRNTTERWLGDEGGELQAKLVTGLSGLESAEPAFELWELSRLVLASDALRSAFEPANGAEIQRGVEALDRDATSTFRRGFAQFIEHHGYRSVMEVEASALSWEEDHPTVYMMIRNYLHADPAASPHRIEERQKKERETATASARKRLSFWKRALFNYSLKEAQDWVAIREHTKSLLVRTTDRGRHYSREMARRLADQGKLAEVMDLYFLTWHEVKALFQDDLTREEAAERIARRKREDERNRTVQLPDMFRGRPKPLRPDERALPDGHRLDGIPVSPGRVTAKARVIMDPRTDAAIEPGEILVAPVTDAGWTPLFVAAAGIVVDIGGTLSHGSTVAREYGLPAVVNVKHGTRMIKTGQTITVDGTKGVVVLDAGE